MGGYSTGFVVYVLANWLDFCATGRLPRQTWQLGIRASRRVHGGASFEYPITLRADVQRALDSLDEDTRRIVHLRYLSGLPRYQVAHRLGVRTVRAMEPLVEAAIGKLTTILNGGSTDMAGTNGSGYTSNQTLEEQRGHELEVLYDRLDHKLTKLPPGWKQLQVKRIDGTAMYSVSVVY